MRLVSSTKCYVMLTLRLWNKDPTTSNRSLVGLFLFRFRFALRFKSVRIIVGIKYFIWIFWFSLILSHVFMQIIVKLRKFSSNVLESFWWFESLGAGTFIIFRDLLSFKRFFIFFGNRGKLEVTINDVFDFVNLVNSSLQKVQKYLSSQNSEPLNVLKWQFLNLIKSPILISHKIWVIEKFWNFLAVIQKVVIYKKSVRTLVVDFPVFKTADSLFSSLVILKKSPVQNPN